MATNNLIQRISLQDDGYSKGVKQAKEALEKLAKENGVAGTSFRNTAKEMNSAKRYATMLTVEYNKLSDSVKNSKFGKELKAQIEQAKQASAEMARISRQVQNDINSMAGEDKGGGGILGKVFKGGTSSLMKAGVAIGVATSAMDLFTDAIKNNVNTAMTFEKSADAIQALTGADAEMMEKLKQSAIDLGGSTTQTASQVMDAFGAIASKNPDLLKSADALSKATEAAIMLSEASGIELADAVDGVTGIMNQFNLSANNAIDIVNMLASASQKGAGNVAFLNSAITQCGSVAGTLGISANEVVSELEMLAKAGMDAGSSGTNLRNIMLTLESSSDKNLKPSVVGLNKALDNLAQKGYNATAMTKLFGKENVAAALTLTKMSSNAIEMTKAITGSNTAVEQQKINNDNLAGSLKALDSKWEKFNLTLNDSNGWLKSTVDWIGSLVDDMIELASSTDEATKMLKKFNQEHGYGDDNGNNGNKVMSKKEYNQRMKDLKAERDRISQLIKDQDKFINNPDKSASAEASRKTAREAKKALQGTYNRFQKEIEDLAQWGKDNYYPKKKKPEPVKPEGNNIPTTKTTKTHTQTPKEKYDEEMLVAKRDYTDGITTSKEKLDAEIKATKDYIDELQKIKKRTADQNNTLASLKVNLKDYTEELKQANDWEIEKQARKDYADEIEKLNRERENGWLSEDEYNSNYLKALQNLINKYNSVANLTPGLVKAINDAKGDIKAIQKNGLMNAFLGKTINSVEDMYDILGGNPRGNDYYKSVRRSEEEFNRKDKGWLKGHIWEGDSKSAVAEFEKWFEENKANLFSIGQILERIKDNIDNTDFLDENGNAMDKNQFKAQIYQEIAKAHSIIGRTHDGESLTSAQQEELQQIEWDIYPTLTPRASKQLQEQLDKAGINLNDLFDDMDLGKAKEILDSLNLDMGDYGDDIKDLLSNFKDLLDWMDRNPFDKWADYSRFGSSKGDKSNFSVTNHTSYQQLAKDTMFNMPTDSLDKAKDELDKMLDKYKEIEDVYVSLRQEADKNGATLEIGDIDNQIDQLEQDILAKRDEIQKKLNLQFRVEGTTEILEGLNTIGSTVQAWEDLADSLDNCKSGFDEFMTVFSTVVSTFETVNGLIQTYNAIASIFGAVNTANAVASTASQTAMDADASAAPARIATKEAEAVANKTLEATMLDLASAEIFAAHASIPFAGPAIAGGLVGGMMGTMAGVHASALALQAMANGGFVDGGNFHGDSTLIRANKGELVLNTTQQRNLFDALNNGFSSNAGGGEVKFTISGDKLVGVLNNQKRTKGKVGGKTLL